MKLNLSFDLDNQGDIDLLADMGIDVDAFLPPQGEGEPEQPAPTPAAPTTPAPGKRGPGRPRKADAVAPATPVAAVPGLPTAAPTPAAPVSTANSGAAPVNLVQEIKDVVGKIGAYKSPLEAADLLRQVANKPNVSSIPQEDQARVLKAMQDHLSALEAMA